MVGGEKQKNKGVKLLQTATMVCYQAPRKVQRTNEYKYTLCTYDLVTCTYYTHTYVHTYI